MKTLRVATLVLSLALGVCWGINAPAQTVPSLINYQGKLTDATGNPLPNGTYGVAFRIWSNSTNTQPSNLVWGHEYDTSLVNGTK